MTETTPPKYPYVAFQMVKKNMAGEEWLETYYLNVSGTHGTIEALNRKTKAGHRVVGHGNFGNNPKFLPLRRWVEGYTGEGLHPLMKDQLSVLEKKKEQMKKEAAK